MHIYYVVFLLLFCLCVICIRHYKMRRRVCCKFTQLTLLYCRKYKVYIYIFEGILILRENKAKIPRHTNITVDSLYRIPIMTIIARFLIPTMLEILSISAPHQHMSFVSFPILPSKHRMTSSANQEITLIYFFELLLSYFVYLQ